MSDLIDRKTAIEFIKKAQCSGCSDIGLCGGCSVLVALKLLEKVPAASSWHRVEEPPKDACDCLVCWTTIHDEETGEVTGHGFWCEMGWYEDGLLGSVGFYCQSRHEETPVRVEPDYWMPIEPPKEDA